MTTDLYNLKNEKVGVAELSDKVFKVDWNPELVHQVIVGYLANQRHPWAHAKTRGEVSGGGKKPWRQKGTGRARVGSIRSPLWRKGGKAHGPTKEKDYSHKINDKMRRKSVACVLSKKFHDGEIKIFDNFNIAEPKTNLLYKLLVSILNKNKKDKKFNLLLIGEKNKNIALASKNLVKTKFTDPLNINTYDLMNYKYVFIDQKSLEDINSRFSK